MKIQTQLKAGVCMDMPRGRADIWAGPLWDNDEAQAACPDVCARNGGKFTGQWVTPDETWGENSVCGCNFPLAC